MIADEIRKIPTELQERLVADRKQALLTDEYVNRLYEAITQQIQAEIAAQLAEANEANRPKWVTLTHGGNRLPVDARRVSALGMRDDQRTYIYMHGQGSAWTVDGNIGEVAAKLGIPLEDADGQ